MQTKARPVVRVTRIKNTCLVMDEASYSVLKQAKLTCLYWNYRDMHPLVEDTVKRIKAKVEIVDFASIYRERMSKISEQWKSKTGRDCKFKSGRIIFSAPCSEKNKAATNALDSALRQFFMRWSFKYNSVYSESDVRSRLVVDFKFMPNQGPILDISKHENKRDFEVELGFTRIKITLYDNDAQSRNFAKPVGLILVSTKAGDKWTPVHSGTFINSTIKDVGSWVTLLPELVRRSLQG